MRHRLVLAALLSLYCLARPPIHSSLAQSPESDHFFENHFDDNVLTNLTNFLRIQTDTEWVKAALLNFNIKKKYDHDEQRIEFYKSLVGKYFKEYPEESEKLLLFS